MTAKQSRLIRLFVILCVTALALFAYPAIATVAQQSSPESAWRRVREAGSYRFLSAVDQTFVPRAIPEMIGQREQRLRLVMRGAVQLPERAYIEMWAENGSTQVQPVALIRDGSQTFMKKDGQVTPVQDPVALIAPTADWLGYLAAAENVQPIDPASGDASNLAGYGFEVSGPRLAEYVREQAEEALRKEPGAPAGLSVASSAILVRLSGRGELWVGLDGLPVRQVLDLHVPEISEGYDVRLHVAVELSDYGDVAGLPRAVQGADGNWYLETSGLDSPILLPETSHPEPPTGVAEPTPKRSTADAPVSQLTNPFSGDTREKASAGVRFPPSGILLFSIGLLGVLLIGLYRRHWRRAYGLIATILVLLLTVQAPLQAGQFIRFAERQAQMAEARAAATDELAKALGLDVESVGASNVGTEIQAAGYGFSDPLSHPSASLTPAMAFAPSGAGVGPVPTAGPRVEISATDEESLIEVCGQGSPDEDFDQDGLNDQLEGCLGTDPYSADSDGDGLSDGLELAGFVITDTHGVPHTWTSDPLQVDSNRDGTSDFLEWAAPEGLANSPDVDGDDVPNAWDDDDDGDGVPDNVDLSPMAVTAGYEEAFTLTIEAADTFTGYQYIELQIQPQDPVHLRYSTTALDWPHDEEGNVTDLDDSTEDVRLIPFLSVEANVAPRADLAVNYGFKVWSSAGGFTLLIPLAPIGEGGAVHAFYGKVAYGPGDVSSGAIQWQGRMVWLVQAQVDEYVNCHDPENPSASACRVSTKSSTLHRYEDPVRLTGLQVSKSGEYEFALFATPPTPQEDKDLVQLQVGLNATFLDYERLEFQKADQTALGQIEDRFLGGYPITSTFGLTPISVTVAHQTVDHRDAGMAELGTRASEMLAPYRTNECPLPGGGAVPCGALVLAWQEDIGMSDLGDLPARDATALRFSLLDIPMNSMRGTRLNIYEWGDPNGWQTMSSARMLSAVEERYRARYETMLDEEYPDLDGDDMRFLTHLAYLAAHAGRLTNIRVDGAVVVPEVPDENAIAAAIGGPGGCASELGAVGEFFGERSGIAAALQWHDNPIYKPSWLQRANKWIGRFAHFSVVTDAAGLVVGGFAMCQAANPGNEERCGNEEALAITNNVINGISVATSAAELANLSIKAARQGMGALKGLATASKAAKGASIVGLVIGLGVTWTAFGLTVAGTDSPVATKMAIATAIVSTIWLVFLFALQFIPGVGQIIAAILGIIDALLSFISGLFGQEWDIARVLLNLFYDAREMTGPVGSPATYGWRSGTAEDRGLIAGSEYTITATHEGRLELKVYTDTFATAKVDDLDQSSARGEMHSYYSGSLSINNGPWNQSPTCTISGTERLCRNTIGARWGPLPPARNVHLIFDVQTVYTYVYAEFGLYGAFRWNTLTDTLTVPETPEKTDVYVDVLPATLDELWNWNVLTNPDRDGDGLPDASEQDTSPLEWDTDGDGLSDGYESRSQDERGTDPGKRDSDGDGLPDALELRLGTQIDDDDTDGDGLTDGEEVCHQDEQGQWVGGWLVDLPGGVQIRVCSDPQESDADGDGLGDLEEKRNRLSPYAFNTAPLLLIASEPFSMGPSGKAGVYVRPSDAVTLTVGLFNWGAKPVSNTLSLCLPAFLENVSGGVLLGDRSPSPTVGSCDDGGILYAWSFSGTHALQRFEAVGTTLTAEAAPQGSETVSAAVWVELPLEKETLGKRAAIVVDRDTPRVTLTTPLADQVLRGEHLVVGGSASDPTSWVTGVALAVAPLGDPDPIYVPASGVSPWAYGWTLPADGVYALRARARDQVGNEAESEPVVVTVDNTPPSVTLSAGDYVSSTTEIIYLGGTASDNLSGLTRVQISINEQPWRTVPLTMSVLTAGTWTYDWGLGTPAQGSHSIRLRAVDRAGNVTDPPLERTVVVDRMPPSDELADGTYLHAPPAVAVGQPYTLTGVADEGGYLPRPLHPAEIAGTKGVFTDTNVWLGLSTIFDDDEGTRAAWLGDFDSDRMADLAVGLPAAAGGNGQAIVFYGRAGGWPVPPDMEMLAESGTVLEGAPGAGLGTLVAAAGDADGDGYADLLVGEEDSARAFLVFGKPNPLGHHVLDGPLYGLSIALQAPEAIASLASAGDVNDDGLDDLLVVSGGRTYLLLGEPKPWTGTVDLSVRASAVWTDALAATGLGDVNGDGIADLAVAGEGTVALFWGSKLYAASAQETRSLGNGDRIFVTGDAAPQVVALGDVNGDGRDDFLYTDGDARHLVFGADDPQVVRTFSPYDGFVAAPGDVDGDGRGDVLLGKGGGEAHLFLGGEDIPAPAATIVDVAGAASAPYAAGADVNSDGSSDLLLLPSRQAAEERGLDYGEAPHVSLAALPRAAGDASEVGSPARAESVRVLSSSARLMATADTFYVDDDDPACGGNVPCYETIQAAIDDADSAGDTIVVGPGVYGPFEIGPGKDGLAVRGVDPDAVFVDGDGHPYAIHVTHTVGISLSHMTLRNAERGVWLEKAGYQGYVTPTLRTELDHLLVHSCDHALYMDRTSTAAVRRCTLVAGADQSKAVVKVGEAPDPDLLPRWEALDSVPDDIDSGGALVSGGESVYALPGGGSSSLYQYGGGGAWAAQAEVPEPVGLGSVTAVGQEAGALYLYLLRSGALGGGVDGLVYAVAVDPSSGDVYVGGEFDAVIKPDGVRDGIATIARWDGTEWQSLGKGLTKDTYTNMAVTTTWLISGTTTIAKTDASFKRDRDAQVNAIVISGTSVYVGGRFGKAGGQTVNNIARWDGTAWHDLDGGVTTQGCGNPKDDELCDVFVSAIAVDGGDVYVGGSFSTAGITPTGSIALWDGDSWSPLGDGIWDGTVTSIAIYNRVAAQ